MHAWSTVPLTNLFTFAHKEPSMTRSLWFIVLLAGKHQLHYLND